MISPYPQSRVVRLFNTLISAGRLQLPCVFVSETGNDHLGEIIKKCLSENNISTQYVSQQQNAKSSIALAFLDEANNADYVFYKDYASQQIEAKFPDIHENDLFIFGSYFSLNPVLRHKVTALLQLAMQNNAVIYYDPNFRKTHIPELPELKPVIEKNFSVADIVRGSDEDFYHIYGEKDLNIVYERISAFCPNLICTAGDRGVHLFTPTIRRFYPSPAIEPLSTVGAGDSFNAGVLFALNKYNITKKDLATLPAEKWDALIKYGMLVATNVCLSYENYISKEQGIELANM